VSILRCRRMMFFVFFQDRREIIGRNLTLSLNNGMGGKRTVEVFVKGAHKVGDSYKRFDKVYLRGGDVITFLENPVRVMIDYWQVVGVSH